MKLVSYSKDEQDQLAILADGLLYDTDLLHPDLPVSMALFLNYWEDVYPSTLAINQKIVEGMVSRKQGLAYDAVEILPPVPHATSCRNTYSFLSLINSISPGDGAAVLQNHDRYPSFYFANHHCFQGPGDVFCMPDHLQKTDFELSVAIVICKAGKNIPAAEAGDYIGGFMIMNNISSRNFQSVKTSLDLFSANGKSFATPIGPMLVTPDELEPYKVDCREGHTGDAYNLTMKCLVNGTEVSLGNLADMDGTFAEIIQEASYGVQLFPGDIIGSGATGTGCFLALNAIGKLNDPAYEEQWLKEGDVIDIDIEGLGILRNTIVRDDSDFSILDRAKNV